MNDSIPLEYDPSFLEWLDRCVAVQVEQAFKPIFDEDIGEEIRGMDSTGNIVFTQNEAVKTNAATVKSKVPRIQKYCSFGSESYEHLGSPYLIDVLKYTTNLNVVLQRIISDLFFNVNVRKNNNVFIPKDAYNCITVWSNGSWKSHPLQVIMEKMVKRGNDVMQHYLVNRENGLLQQEIGKNNYDALCDFTNSIVNLQRFPEIRRKLLKDTEHTILTNQYIVHGDVIDNCIASTT